MTRFLIKSALLAGGILLVVATMVRSYNSLYPPEKSYYMAALDKLSLLTTQSSPRLVFIGGSATAFGIDSQLISDSFGYNPVNMGVHIGLGIDFMLSQIEPLLRAGDVVFLALEYHAFAHFVSTDAEILARLIERSPGLLPQLSFGEVRAVLDHGYMRHLGRMLRAAKGRPERLLEFNNALYQRQFFNHHGDFVGHHGRNPAAGISVGRFVYKKARQLEAGIDRINRFWAKCQSKQVQVFLTFPPYSRWAYDRDSAEIRQLERRLRERLKVKICGSPDRFSYPDNHYFDSIYHLNERGKMAYSKDLADLLKPELQ
jgi:hypothetical protein